MARRKKKRKTSNIVLLILGLFLFAFIVVNEYIFWKTGTEPSTLIQCVLGAGGLEALLLGAIKISKVITGEKVKKNEGSETE